MTHNHCTRMEHYQIKIHELQLNEHEPVHSMSYINSSIFSRPYFIRLKASSSDSGNVLPNSFLDYKSSINSTPNSLKVLFI